MDGVTFETFDPAPYQRVPVVNLHSMVVLAKALLDGKPVDAPAAVNKRADKLHEAVGVAENELTDRLRERAAAPYGPPVLFDGGADALWTYCFRSLEGLSAYMHSAFDRFVEDPKTPLHESLVESRERAKRASALRNKMFGDRGVTFLRGTFRDQCEVAGSILRLVKEDGLVDELASLVGPALVNQLFGLQEIYESMVVDQLKNPPASVQSLNELRYRLTRLIGQYNNAVLDMLDEETPASLGVVLTALRPMITLRELLARNAKATGKEVEVEVGQGEPVGDAVVAEPQGGDVGEGG